ncbi:MAG: pentapeptide repeat-containing protein [Lysobacterales bacterium]
MAAEDPEKILHLALEGPMGTMSVSLSAIAASLSEPFELKERKFDTRQVVRGLTIDKEMSLEGYVFAGGIEFSKCTFKRSLNFSDVDLQGHDADFADCRFEDNAVFRPKDTARLSLRSAIFQKGFEIAIPRTAVMTVDARYAQVNGTATIAVNDYGQPPYSGPTKMASLSAYEMVIGKESSLEVSGIDADLVDFQDSTLQDKASLYLFEVHAKELRANGLRMIDKATVSFNQVSLNRARFSRSNIERFVFSNVLWPKVGARVQLLEEDELRQGRHFDKKISDEKLADLLESVTENYRQLVLNYEARRNYALAEEFHISEMEMMRFRTATQAKSPVGRFLRSHLNPYRIYWLLSKYGTGYGRATTVLALILLVFSFLFMLNGVTQKNAGGEFEYNIREDATHRWRGLSKLVKDSGAALSLTMSVVTLQKDRPMDPEGVSGSFLASLLIILAPAQAALLLFALRRKFRRSSI